jgi:hypothetical protein
MRAVSARAILTGWERGARRCPQERALVLLASAFPGTARGELAALPIGRRDELLLSVRARTFGDGLAGVVECPGCRERFDLTLSTTEILDGRLARSEALPPAHVTTLEVAGFVVRLRLLDGRDLDAAAGAGTEPEDVVRHLLRRCVLGAERDGQPVDPGDLPGEVVERVDAWLTEQDPLSDLSLALRCAACGHTWTAVLDVGAFFWVEVAAKAQRLLHEVHTLASAYGWSEADILKLSPARRQAYLELVGTP